MVCAETAQQPSTVVNKLAYTKASQGVVDVVMFKAYAGSCMWQREYEILADLANHLL